MAKGHQMWIENIGTNYNLRKAGSMITHKIWTVSGREFDLSNPQPDEIRLADIILPLAEAPRYAAQTRQPLSVLSHQLTMSKIVPRHLSAAALLHDAGEAYTGDIIGPIKRLLPPDARLLLKTLELGILEAIEKALGIEFVSDLPDLDKYDKALAEHEMLYFYGRPVASAGLFEPELAQRLISRSLNRSKHVVAFEYLSALAHLSPAARDLAAQFNRERRALTA